ncbi:MAG TPA: O-antigen ligase family protein [Candidatus Eisenbacteria bacterium]|jgi:glycosyltransferase involved in cell wall biosynthesis/O-antigen ligase
MSPTARQAPNPLPPAAAALARAAELSFLLLAAVLPWTIAPMGITAALCGTLTLARLARGARWPRTPVDLPALGWAAALLLATLFAQDRSASLPRLAKAAFPALVGLAAFHGAERGRGLRALAILLASSALASLLGLSMFLVRGAGFAGRARGPVGHYMTFAGQLLLFASLAAGVALLARGRRWRVGALAALVLAGAALAVTYTRSAWLGLAVAGAVILGVARPRWLPALGIAIAVVVAAAPGVYRQRLLSVFDPHNEWNRERTYMWQAGARMFRDHPLTGVGLQDLHALYDRYRPPEAAEPAGHLHSVPIQIAATMGLAGLIAFALLYASLFRAAARGLRPAVRAGGLAAGLRLGVTAGLAGFLAAGLFEWNFGDEELLYPLYLLTGLAWAARQWEPAGAGPSPAPTGRRSRPGGPRVALVHDWLTGMRGGERVLERLCGLFPDADLFTLVWNRGSVSPAIERHRITTSFLQRMPGAARLYRWYLPLFPAAVERLGLEGYDVVISTSHAVATGAQAPPGAFHLSYVFTPMRYIWELEEQYFPPGRFPWPLDAYVRGTCARLREWDVRASRRPHVVLADSAHVARRIARHWGREAEVVYPPVDLARFTPGRGERSYDLVAGAFAPYKRADIAVLACARLGRRLVVVGSGQEEGRLKRLAGPSVEFRGWVADEEMARLYQGARALIFPGEEDFGIVPVEAMASGCPVVAFGRGGALETVGRGARAEDIATVERGGVAAVPNGALFGAQTADAVCAALEVLGSRRYAPDALRAAAEPFAPEVFDRRFREALERGLAAWRQAAGRQP